MLAGMTTPVPRTALEIAATNVGLDWLEFSRSDEAQQLSACTCVMTRPEPVLSESLLCMGQSPPSEQHAMRASGLGAHPAQTAAFPPTNASVSASADSRLTSPSTPLECSTAQALSNERSSNSEMKNVSDSTASDL
jgi:hypothetical protein